MDELILQVAKGVFGPGVQCTANWRQVPAVDRFFVITGPRGPRWLIPMNPASGWAGLKRWRPYGAKPRLKWGVLMGLYRMGLAGRVPGVSGVGIVRGQGDEAWRHPEYEAGRLTPVIYIGSPNVHRKAVASLVDGRAGFVAGILKAPLAEQASGNIVHEGRMLDELGRVIPGLGPRLLWMDEAQGLSLQECVQGRLTETHWTPAHLELLEKLGADGRPTSLAEQTRWMRQWAGMETGSENLPEGATAGDLEDVKDVSTLKAALELLADERAVESAWVHGDFSAWNLMRVKGGRLAAFDWESSRRWGLPLVDMFHFDFVQAHLFRKREFDAERVMGLEGVEAAMRKRGLDRGAGLRIALAYLAGLYIVKHLENKYPYADYIFERLCGVMRRIGRPGP